MALRRTCLTLLTLLAACRGRGGGGATPGPTAAVPPPPPSPSSMATVTTPVLPPTLCAIDLDCGGMPITSPDTKVPCRFQVRDGAGLVVYDDHAGVDLHGQSSLQFPKKNYAVELWTAAGATNPTDLLGMGHDSDWVLDGMWSDRSLMRNAVVLDSFAAIGSAHFGAAGRYCTLALSGESEGIYRLEQKIKRSKDRVDIAADDGTGRSFIVKQDQGGTLYLALGQENLWKLVYPAVDTSTAAQRAGVQAWLNGLGAALAQADPAAGAAAVLQDVDRNMAVDWILLQELSKNIDAYSKSIYFASDDGQPAMLIPWDFDLTFGQPTVQGEPGAEQNDQPQGWVVHRSAFIQVLSASADLRAHLGPRWRELRAGPFSTNAIQRRLADYQVTLTPAAVAANFARWPLPEITYQQIFGDYSLYPVSSYNDEVSKLLAYILKRLAWIDAHIDDYPN
jgi:hypothetical protein